MHSSIQGMNYKDTTSRSKTFLIGAFAAITGFGTLAHYANDKLSASSFELSQAQPDVADKCYHDALMQLQNEFSSASQDKRDAAWDRMTFECVSGGLPQSVDIKIDPTVGGMGRYLRQLNPEG